MTDTEHVLAVALVGREWQPRCLCGWKVMPCVSVEAAQLWATRHRGYSQVAGLTPFEHTCDGVDVERGAP